MNEEIGGVIYSLKEENLGILKDKKDPVYIKYLSRVKGINSTKLKQGNYLFFYLSRKNKSIAGYSKIDNISIKKPSEIKQDYANRIQMNDQDFNQYTSKRKDKPLLILELNKIKEFKNDITVDYPITMGGKYLTENEVEQLINK